MKRVLQIAALALMGYSASATDLAYKIPKNAFAVASLKTDQLFSLLSVPDFSRSVIGKQLLRGLSGQQHSAHTIQDMGISLSSPLYYYNRKTDSVYYNCVLISVADVRKMDNFIENIGEGTIQRDGDIRMLSSRYDKSLFMWNDEMALFIMPYVTQSYDRWSSYNDYTATEENPVAIAIDTAVMTVAIAEAVAEPAPPAPRYNKKKTTSKKGRYTKTKKKYYTPPVIVEEVPVDEKPDKNILALAWARQYAEKVFRKTPNSSSILDNRSYLRSTDKDAVATLYVKNMPDVYSGLFGRFYGKYMGQGMAGYGAMNARLYMGRDEARLTAELELSDRMANAYDRIYNSRRINKDFLKYINGDRMIGFASYSMDTRAYLDEFPRLMAQTYGSYFVGGSNKNKYKQEMSLSADFLSLLLDEEAVAEVIKGDALLLLNDVSRKTVTYTTYDYDDNYERKEVEKTKTETQPDFLLMLSSDDTRLIRKLLRYGIDKEQVNYNNGIYSFSKKAMKSSPLPVHMLIKDGIIFVGTSLRDLQDINSDRYEAHVSRAQKDLILNNTMSLYFNPRNLRGKFNQKDMGSFKDLQKLNNLLGNSGVLYARSGGIHGNYISSELVAEVPGNNENALQYFFSLIDDANKD